MGASAPASGEVIEDGPPPAKERVGDDLRFSGSKVPTLDAGRNGYVLDVAQLEFECA